MPVDPSLLALMPMTFDWRKKNGQDGWQNPTFAPAQSLQGVMEDNEHEVVDDKGVKRMCRGTVYLADVYGVTTQDELDYCGERIGDIIRVDNYPDPRTGGNYGSVVHFG